MSKISREICLDRYRNNGRQPVLEVRVVSNGDSSLENYQETHFVITNKELTDILLAYRAGNISKLLFHKCLSKIVQEIYQHPSYYFRADDADGIIREATNLCVQKSDRFDMDRGKAINFFITIVGCYLKQVHLLAKRIQNEL